MSRKLQDVIQSIKGLGRYKPILLAIARRAYDDGTNVWSSKEDLAGFAECSRWTAYRHIAALIEVGILIEADSHICKIQGCNKGKTHSCGGGHYTIAYNINLSMLQNPSKLVEKLHLAMLHGATLHEPEPCSTVPKTQCSTVPKSNVAPCDAKQSLESRCARPTDEASVLRTVRKEGSKEEALVASLPSLAPTDETEKATPNRLEAKELEERWLSLTGHTFKAKDWPVADKLVADYGSPEFVLSVMTYIVSERPRSAKILWRDFWVFADNWELNRDIYLADHRSKDARENLKTEAAQAAARAAQPAYRRQSGIRDILGKGDL